MDVMDVIDGHLYGLYIWNLEYCFKKIKLVKKFQLTFGLPPGRENLASFLGMPFFCSVMMKIKLFWLKEFFSHVWVSAGNLRGFLKQCFLHQIEVKHKIIMNSTDVEVLNSASTK